MSPRPWLLRLLLFAGIAAGIVWAGYDRGQFDPRALDAWLSGFGPWAPLGFVVFFAAGTVIFLPGLLFALAGGVLFGPVGARSSISSAPPWGRRSPSSSRATSRAAGWRGRRPGA